MQLNPVVTSNSPDLILRLRGTRFSSVRKDSGLGIQKGSSDAYLAPEHF